MKGSACAPISAEPADGGESPEVYIPVLLACLRLEQVREAGAFLAGILAGALSSLAVAPAGVITALLAPVFAGAFL